MSNDFIESAVEQVEGNGAEINSFDSINSTWEEVITPGLITAPQLSSNILTGWVGDFVDALSESTQTPLGLSVMMALSVVATCVQKRFEVSPYQDDYKEPLSLWTLTATSK